MTAVPDIVCRPVGIVHSRFQETVGVPVQTAGVPHEQAVLEVFAEFEPGLKDIAGFEYLILLTHLHLCPHERLEVVPFLDTQSHGIFATRAPARPNRIGLSIVRLESIDGRMLRFSGNDWSTKLRFSTSSPMCRLLTSATPRGLAGSAIAWTPCRLRFPTKECRRDASCHHPGITPTGRKTRLIHQAGG